MSYGHNARCRPSKPMCCSFCLEDETKVAPLVASDGVAICKRCAEAALIAIKETEAAHDRK